MRKCIDMLLQLGVGMTAVTIRAILLPWLPDSNAALKTTGELIGLSRRIGQQRQGSYSYYLGH